MSISLNSRPFQSQSSSLRSAASPRPGMDDGLAAAGEPVYVDLPTFGKPTTATRGTAHASPVPQEIDDPRDHLADAEARRVELDRIVRRAKGTVLALAVSGVALALAGEHRLELLPGLRGATPRTPSSSAGETFRGASGLTTVPMSRPSAT